jgi:phage terminase small subunit
MPFLSNAKHERMALALSEGKSQKQAYIEAGYSPKGARGAACRVLQQNASISERVTEILDKREHTETKAVIAAIQSAKLTLESHLSMLADLRDHAIADKQYSAAIAAEKNRGLAAGFYVHRVQASAADGFTDRTEEQLMADMVELLASAGYTITGHAVDN